MKVRLFQKDDLVENRVDIYYNRMTEPIKTVLYVLKQNRPELYGTEEGEKVVLSVADVYYIDTVDKKTFAYLKDRVYQIQGNLTSLEESLQEHGFCRINKSNLVNIYRIKRVRAEANMRTRVVLENGEELVISRFYRKIFHKYLENMRGVLNE